jgi:hypothetical protein
MCCSEKRCSALCPVPDWSAHMTVFLPSLPLHPGVTVCIDRTKQTSVPWRLKAFLRSLYSKRTGCC